MQLLFLQVQCEYPAGQHAAMPPESMCIDSCAAPPAVSPEAGVRGMCVLAARPGEAQGAAAHLQAQVRNTEGSHCGMTEASGFKLIRGWRLLEGGSPQLADLRKRIVRVKGAACVAGTRSSALVGP